MSDIKIMDVEKYITEDEYISEDEYYYDGVYSNDDVYYDDEYYDEDDNEDDYEKFYGINNEYYDYDEIDEYHSYYDDDVDNSYNDIFKNYLLNYDKENLHEIVKDLVNNEDVYFSYITHKEKKMIITVYSDITNILNSFIDYVDNTFNFKIDLNSICCISILDDLYDSEYTFSENNLKYFCYELIKIYYLHRYRNITYKLKYSQINELLDEAVWVVSEFYQYTKYINSISKKPIQ